RVALEGRASDRLEAFGVLADGSRQLLADPLAAGQRRGHLDRLHVELQLFDLAPESVDARFRVFHEEAMCLETREQKVPQDQRTAVYGIRAALAALLLHQGREIILDLPADRVEPVDER